MCQREADHEADDERRRARDEAELPGSGPHDSHFT
jgi:hypothetical protein